MKEYDIPGRYRREAELRARVPFLNLRRPLVATPEIVALLDSEGCFLRHSAKHADELLATFSFRGGQDVHSTVHPGCDDRTCEFVANWSKAWELHRLGAPVEWLHLSATSNTVLKLRLQPVSYACSIIFGRQLESFDECSVLFLQNLTHAGEPETRTANDIHVKNASIYQKRRSTDTDPDLVASIDDRLRTVTARLVDAQTAACRRLAEDLHDGLGQTLCMVRLDIESAAAKLDSSEGSDTLNLAARHVRRAQQELREITQGLYSKDTDISGLIDSLQALAADFRATKQDIALVVDFQGFRRDVPVDLGVAIYRIVQESLNNIARHSNASEASLTLESNKNGVHLAVSDNGVGLPSADSIRPGLGLVTMRERTERLGGYYEIRCPETGGFTVDVRWPREIVVSLR